ENCSTQQEQRERQVDEREEEEIDRGKKEGTGQGGSSEALPEDEEKRTDRGVGFGSRGMAPGLCRQVEENQGAQQRREPAWVNPYPRQPPGAHEFGYLGKFKEWGWGGSETARRPWPPRRPVQGGSVREKQTPGFRRASVEPVRSWPRR